MIRKATMQDVPRIAEIIVFGKRVAYRPIFNNDVVSLGKTVTFVEIPDGDEESYTIVGSAEADPLEGLISNDSPIAKGLLGKTTGDKVKILTPGGEMDVEIISIS